MTSAAAAPALYIAEPPAAYLARPAMVVDCSVLAAVLFEEPSRDTAAQRLAGSSTSAARPATRAS